MEVESSSGKLLVSLLCLWLFNQFLCHLSRLILHYFFYFLLKVFLNFTRFSLATPTTPHCTHPFLPSVRHKFARACSALILISQLRCSRLHFCSVFVSSLTGLEGGKRVIFSFIFLLFFLLPSLWEKTAETDLLYSQKCGIERRKAYNGLVDAG